MVVVAREQVELTLEYRQGVTMQIKVAQDLRNTKQYVIWETHVCNVETLIYYTGQRKI